MIRSEYTEAFDDTGSPISGRRGLMTVALALLTCVYIAAVGYPVVRCIRVNSVAAAATRAAVSRQQDAQLYNNIANIRNSAEAR